MVYSLKTISTQLTAICVKSRLKFRNFMNYCECSRNFAISHACGTSVELSYASYDIHKSSAAPIVIMHGLFGSKNNWNTLAKAMNQQTRRRVLTVDARNHGDSPHSAIMNYPSMAQDVKEFCKSLDIGKAILIGHSMGGAAMMCTALNYPDIVEKLLVVDMSPIKTSPSLRQMTEIINTMQSIEFDRSGKTLSEARKRIDQLLSETISSPTLRQFLTTNVIEKSPEEFSWRVNLPIIAENFSNNIAIFPQIIPQLMNGTFDGPTLFIAGSESDYIKEKDHVGIKKIFTAGKIEYIKDAGHWVQSEKPAEFLNVATAFINQ